MVIITTVVVLNQRNYSTTLILKNAAGNLSLDIRQAQIFGISVRENIAGSGNFTNAYGFHIGGTDSASYTIFADVNNDGVYTAADAGAEVTKIDLPTGVTKTICIVVSNGCAPVGEASVTFLRPDPTARIFPSNPPGQGLRVTLTNGVDTRSVTIYTTGQISVQ
jgi:hypothetical protein